MLFGFDAISTLRFRMGKIVYAVMLLLLGEWKDSGSGALAV